MFSFLKKDKDQTALLINIGNGSIAVASALFNEEKPRFLYTARHSFVMLDKPDAKVLSESVIRTLDEALSAFSTKGYDNKYWDYKEKRVSKILVVFSSPWFIPKIKHIEIRKDNPFVITEKFLNDILEKEEVVFRDELKVDLEEKVGSYDVVERSIVNVKINGYILKKNIGKTTKNFEAYLRMSVVSTDYVKKVRDIIEKYTHSLENEVIFHTFPFVSFTIARDVFSNSSSFILLDVTGEVTDLTLVQNESIVAVASFPCGRNYIIRQIAKSFNTTFELAESTLRLFISKKLDDLGIKKIEEVLVNIEREWAIYFENSLLELSPQMVLPYKFFMTADSDVSVVYKNFLSLSKTDTTSLIRRNIELIHISSETLSNYYQNDSTSQVSEFIAILALFYNRISRY
ncbi:MAG: cell division protein FtsA [Minisyncoccia bacterium]